MENLFKFLLMLLIFTSTAAIGDGVSYVGKNCTSCHESGEGKSQSVVTDTTSPRTAGSRASALGIKALASSASCSTSLNSMMHKAYLGYYARCPDEGGLSYWCGQLDTKNGDLSTLIASFGTSTEYTKRFSGMTDTQLITNLYQNMFNRGTDEAGLNFYINLLDQRRKEFSNSHGGNSSGATEYALSRIALDVLNGASGSDLTTLNGKISQCSALPKPTCTDQQILKNGACVAAKTRTLSDLGKMNGIDTISLNRLLVAKYTDLLTPQETKTECTHKYMVNEAIYLCDEYKTYKRVMYTELYMNAPVDGYIKFQVDDAQISSNIFIANLVKFSKKKLEDATRNSLLENSVASAITALSSRGPNVVPAFVSAFNSQIENETAKAIASINEWINMNVPVNEAAVPFVSGAFPVIDSNSMRFISPFPVWESF